MSKNLPRKAYLKTYLFSLSLKAKHPRYNRFISCLLITNVEQKNCVKEITFRYLYSDIPLTLILLLFNVVNNIFFTTNHPCNISFLSRSKTSKSSTSIEIESFLTQVVRVARTSCMELALLEIFYRNCIMIKIKFSSF